MRCGAAGRERGRGAVWGGKCDKSGRGEGVLRFFCRVSRSGTRQNRICRVPDQQHSAKYLKNICFIFCRVPDQVSLDKQICYNKLQIRIQINHDFKKNIISCIIISNSNYNNLYFKFLDFMQENLLFHVFLKSN